MGPMPRPPLTLRRPVNIAEMDRQIKKAIKEGNTRYMIRLQAIKMLAQGHDKKDIAKTLGISTRTLNRWIHLWNNGGYEGLNGGKNIFR